MKTPIFFLTTISFVSLGLLGVPARGQSRARSQGTINQDTTTSSVGRPAANTTGAPDGVARLNGTLYYIKDRQATQVVRPQRFAEGLALEADGGLLLQDGRKVRLVEGQMVTLAGEVRDAPRNIDLPRPLPPPAPARNGRGSALPAPAAGPYAQWSPELPPGISPEEARWRNIVFRRATPKPASPATPADQP